MGDRNTQILSWSLQLKNGAYTRVEYDLMTRMPKLCAVDVQDGPNEENKVKVWKRSKQAVFRFKGGQQHYLLKVDEKKLMLEVTPGALEPDINRLEDCYWFLMEPATPSQQFRIHSKSFPALCLITKEEGSFDLDELQATTFSIAVFIL